jgi:hypothetical protein
MATKQLSVMAKDLRAEVGHALSIAQGTNQYETLKYLLARTQEELWVAFVWPDLVLRSHVSMVAGQFTYPYPTGMSFDAVRQVFVSQSASSDNWDEIAYGIGEDSIRSDGSNSKRADPVQAWDAAGPDLFRVYPTPNTASGTVRLKGQRALNPFVADSDVSTLDATTVVLFAAAELLARAKAEDAAIKMQKAQRHLTKLLGNKISAKMKVSTLGGGVTSSYPRTNRNLLWQS